MNQRTITLPLRTLSLLKPSSPQWICRRCLVTGTEGISQNTPIPTAQIGNASTATESKLDSALLASQSELQSAKLDFLLKKPLKQPIPVHFLQHSTSDALHENEKKQRELAAPHRRTVGVVVSSGKMDRTVKVRLPARRWNKLIGKYFAHHRDFLVHDPNNSLVEGDVVQLHKLKKSKTKHFVVGAVISPFGSVDDRSPVPSADERLAAYKEKRFAKLERRQLRRKAALGDAESIQKLKDMGLDPGDGAEPGVGMKDNAQQDVGKKINPTPGAILGEKGQKLPTGVLPGGKQEVGNINDRSLHNVRKAMRHNEKAEENLLEAKEKSVLLEHANLGTDSVLR